MPGNSALFLPPTNTLVLRYYLIAGEASGDLHGAGLIRALRAADPEADIRCWGGDLMAAAGGEVVKHYRDLAFMGFVEVARNLRTILRNEKWCRADITAFVPDRLVLIDYPGFNLRIAKWARPAGLDITYYISPQVWAWHTSRVKQLRDNVDRLLVILPFETEFFARNGVKATFVGHPLLDVVQRNSTEGDGARVQREVVNSHGGLKTVALLPGSRTQEIKTSLPIMLAAAARHPGYDYIVAGAPGQTPAYYEDILHIAEAPTNVTILQNKTYDLLATAHAAVVTSGTATLETALFGVPQVVVYKGNWISYHIAKRLVASRIDYISLVNLVMDAPVVPELIQGAFNATNVAEHLGQILDGPQRERQLADLTRLRERLGDGGAAARAAWEILQPPTS